MHAEHSKPPDETLLSVSAAIASMLRNNVLAHGDLNVGNILHIASHGTSTEAHIEFGVSSREITRVSAREFVREAARFTTAWTILSGCYEAAAANSNCALAPHTDDALATTDAVWDVAPDWASCVEAVIDNRTSNLFNTAASHFGTWLAARCDPSGVAATEPWSDGLATQPKSPDDGRHLIALFEQFAAEFSRADALRRKQRTHRASKINRILDRRMSVAPSDLVDTPPTSVRTGHQKASIQLPPSLTDPLWLRSARTESRVALAS